MANLDYIDLHEIYMKMLLIFAPVSVVLVFITDFSFSSYVPFISFGSYVDAFIVVLLIIALVLFLRFISKMVATGVLSILNYKKVLKFPHSDIRSVKDTAHRKYYGKFIFVRTSKSNIRGYRKPDNDD